MKPSVFQMLSNVAVFASFLFIPNLARELRASFHGFRPPIGRSAPVDVWLQSNDVRRGMLNCSRLLRF